MVSLFDGYEDEFWTECFKQQYDGIAITEEQLNHLDELVNNTKIKNILVFPAAGNPEEAAALFQKFTVSNP